MSKYILFDFCCTQCGKVFEEMTKPGDYWSHCPECGANAKRELSPPRINHAAMAGQESASPETLRHFDRVHQQRKAIEERRFRDHGDYGKPAGAD